MEKINGVYVAINNKNLIKVGTTNNLQARQKRFDIVPKNRKNANMKIQVFIPLAHNNNVYAWAVESLLRWDLFNHYNIKHTTIDTFMYDPSTFYATAYIKAFCKKVKSAEKRLNTKL